MAAGWYRAVICTPAFSVHWPCSRVILKSGRISRVAAIRPKIIVCLGRIAATRLIRPDFKITREHGQWTEKAGVHMTALYHPAAILRDPRKRPETFDDLKSLQAKIREVCTNIY